MPSDAASYYKASPSKLNAWLDCPRRFKFVYVERRRTTKQWAHFSFGTTVHNALKKWWELPVPLRRPENVAHLVDNSWVESGYRDSDQSAAWRARAEDMVTSYVTHVDPSIEPRAQEMNVSLLTGALTVSGRIDRLDEREGQLVVVDYKTGKAVSTEDEARSSMALAIYAGGVAYRYKQPVGPVELHHVPSNTIVRWQHTQESLDRQLRRADAIGCEARDAERAVVDDASIVDELFPPSTGPLCGYCDFRELCPEGTAATEEREPWAGLADYA